MATNQAIVGIQPDESLLVNEYLFYFLVHTQPELEALGRGATQSNINAGHIKDLEIALPSVPVQERIVQILQKADEVLRKRHEALELADAVLAAAYRDLFGDPDSNPFNWPVETLDKYLVESRYGTSERTSAYGDGDPVLRIPNVINRTIDTTDLKYLKVSDPQRKMLLLREGDVLVVRTNGNKDYVGRCAVFGREEDYIFASYLIRLRFRAEYLNPHYVVAFMATPFARMAIDLNSRTSAGQYNISSSGLRAIHIPVPPLPRQMKFLDQYEQWKQTKARLESGLRDADSMFACLLAKAFIGELTAEWEEANAEWITSRVELQERLPRLLLVALIREAAARTRLKSAQATVLVTALMKYAFLLQMEGNGRRQFYRFVPYLYGPFAKELYGDLQRLQKEGVVTVEDDREEERTRITLTDPAGTDRILTELPEDVRDDVTSILDAYGALNHKNLLKAVYEKYPAYSKRSRLRPS